MGRTERSQGLAPPAVRKDARAKQARYIINKTIPAILLSNSRAKQGVESSVLIVNPGAGPPHVDQPDGNDNEDESHYAQRKGQGRRKIKHDIQALKTLEFDTSKQKHVSRDDAGSKSSQSSPLQYPKEMIIRIMWTDTLTAAAALAKPSTRTTNKKQPNVCILNMASPLRPGGGVLNGATSQEEFLCSRTTLLPSLKESFYRLPEVGGVFTHDVLVFRNSRPLHEPLGEISVAERFWIDVISAGMLRFPQLQGEDDQDKQWSSKDRILVEAKMRAILRIASHHGVKKLVLGAWGCGAYGNPVHEVAEAWKKIIIERDHHLKKAKDDDAWPSIEEIIFAITNRAMADEFACIFDKHVETESDSDMDSREEVTEKDHASGELREKIQQLQGQLSGTQNPDLKSRLGMILDGLKMQLEQQERETGNDFGDDKQNRADE